MGYFVHLKLKTWQLFEIASRYNDIESLERLLDCKHIRKNKHSPTMSIGSIIRFYDETTEAISYKTNRMDNHATLSRISHDFDIRKKTNVEYCSNYNSSICLKRSFLNCAAEHNAYDAVKFWLNLGASIDDSKSKAKYSYLPDSLSVARDNEKMKRILARPYHPKPIIPSLFKLSFNDFIECRKKLILLAIQSYDYEAIVNLFKLRNIDAILISFGNDIVNSQKFSTDNLKALGMAFLLYEAVYHCAEAVVSFLLKQGADATITVKSDVNENTALELAESLEHNKAMIKTIYEKSTLPIQEFNFEHNHYSFFSAPNQRDIFNKQLIIKHNLNRACLV